MVPEQDLARRGGVFFVAELSPMVMPVYQRNDVRHQHKSQQITTYAEIVAQGVLACEVSKHAGGVRIGLHVQCIILLCWCCRWLLCHHHKSGALHTHTRYTFYVISLLVQHEFNIKRSNV